MKTADTIAAIATPAGQGGIGVVRLSGPAAIHIARQHLRSRETSRERESKQELPFIESWRVHLADLVDKSGRADGGIQADELGQVIDTVLVSFFAAPRSYTGEDVVEISCHGSPVVLRYLLEQCLASGARLAEPGEFTMRAFLNGRIDLSQAEAVRDLIEAQTLYQAKIAAQQIHGAVSNWLAPCKKELVGLIAALEAGIDFAEDDVSVLSQQNIGARLASIAQELHRIAASFSIGKIIHQGLTLAIVGRPNVGKSSLFNCLLERDRAIVTATPGTTRDLVSETAEVEGIPLRFVDTAGIREAFDEAEAIGVRKSLEAAAESDLTLLVLDGSSALAAEDSKLLAKLDPLERVLVVVNKCDLPARLTEQELETALRERSGTESTPPILFVSAMRREGIDLLRNAIVEAALPALSGNRETQFLTNIRHERLVSEAVRAVSAAQSAAENNLPHEMLLLDLYNALRPLSAVTGETTVEDILTQIFSTFCIGK